MQRRRPAPARSARALAATALLLAVALPVVAADAARIPVYRDPPTYAGITRAPVLAPPPTPAAVPLAASGTFPDALVDEAGTAHIVWNDGRGDLDDAAVYCRLKRGARGCDAPPIALRWAKGYGTGDGPEFNIDSGGPRIARIGDQLVVLSQRYPTIGEKPDGASSSTVVAWVSGDGGRTWTDASIVGKWALGQVQTIGAGSDVSLLNLGHDPLCGGMCVTQLRSGQYAADSGNLATEINQAYSATLAVAGGVPTAAFNDLSDRIFLRRWSGAGSPVDPARWTSSPPVPGQEPSLAGGPGGVALLSRPGLSRPYEVRTVVDRGGGLAVGAATVLSTADAVAYGRLAQDGSGRLLAAWQQSGGPAPGVRLRPSEAPGVFGPAQTLITGQDNGQLELATAPDGGGFAVLNHTGGVNSPGQIVATGFGTTAPTGRPGVAGVPGGGQSGGSCRQVRFGSFDVQAASGCLYYGTGADARKVSTGGEVDLYGLKIVPDAGARLIIDPVRLTLDSIGQVKVLVRSPLTGDVVLWHGVLKVDLSAARPGTKLFDFPVGAYAAKVLGFDVGANIQVFLGNGNVRIPMSLRLPPAFLGAAGETELIADRATGLHLDSLHLRIGPVPLGAVTLENFDLTYRGADQLWLGAGALRIAGAGRIAATAEFRTGRFNGASIDFTPPAPIVIGPFVYLLNANGGFTADPVKIEIGGAIGAGAAVAGQAPVRVDGKARMEFPATGPARFEIGGDVRVLSLKAATGRLRFQTDGYADFSLQTNQDFAVLSFDARLQGFVDGTTGQAAADFAGKACINFVVGCLVSAGLDAAISPKGLSVCGSAGIDDFGASVGVQFTLAGLQDATETLASTPAFFVPAVGAGIVLAHLQAPCHSSDFRVAPPRARAAQAGGERTVQVAAGLPSQTLLVTGEGATPDVDVVGPGGTVARPDPGDRARRSAAGSALAVPAASAVLFVLDKPRAGVWTVRPRPGSAPIKAVRLSDGYRPARPRATVQTRGTRRVLRYRIADLGAGQQVQFTERGAFGTRILGTATRAAGTLPLPARALAGGPRTVTAVVQRSGFATDRVDVARYTAPRPSGPPPVARLRVTRKGSTLTATWRPARGAARQTVRLSGAKGTRLLKLVGARARTARFTNVRRDERVTVEVTGLTAGGVRGTTRRTVSTGAKR